MNREEIIKLNMRIRHQRRLAKIRRPVRLSLPKESLETYEPSRTKHYRHNINVNKKPLRNIGFRYKHQKGSIPQGIYCYDRDVCPYWRSDKSKWPQNGGMCLYLKMKDIDTLDLLWDMVKSCNLNE